MGIPPSREYQDIRSPIEDEVFSIIEEKAGGDNTVTVRVPLALHEEEEGATAPRRKTLAILQRVPKNLTYGDCGTIHVQHVPNLLDDEILKVAGDKEKGKLQMVRNIFPSLFEENNAKTRQNDLCKKNKDISIHTSLHDLCLDVSLLDRISLGAFPAERNSKVFSQLCTLMSHFDERSYPSAGDYE